MAGLLLLLPDFVFRQASVGKKGLVSILPPFRHRAREQRAMTSHPEPVHCGQKIPKRLPRLTAVAGLPHTSGSGTGIEWLSINRINNQDSGAASDIPWPT
ncbi:MAG TPA: hypothetical protein PL157_08130 [Acidobacteriota bacterium]|nr:hypothetical protein [Acidobacteriota bacterium]